MKKLLDAIWEGELVFSECHPVALHLFVGHFLTTHFSTMDRGWARRTFLMSSRHIRCKPSIIRLCLSLISPLFRYDPEVGYCQGLPFVVAVLLLNVSHSDRAMEPCLIPIKMPDEEAFCLLVRFMYVYDLRGHFLPEMPKLQLRLVLFSLHVSLFTQ
jgi:hypothetical protein